MATIPSAKRRRCASLVTDRQGQYLHLFDAWEIWVKCRENGGRNSHMKLERAGRNGTEKSGNLGLVRFW